MFFKLFYRYCQDTSVVSWLYLRAPVVAEESSSITSAGLSPSTLSTNAAHDTN